MGMKTKQAYIIGAIIIIVLGLLLFKNGSQETKPTDSIDVDTSPETANATPPPAGGSGSLTSSPAPSDGSGASVEIMDLFETPEPEPIPRIPTVSELDGLTFKMISYNGNPLSPDINYTVSFNGFSLSAKFCNSLSGNFVLDGSLMKVGNMISTQKYCGEPENLMGIETSFVSILGYGAQIHQVGSTIVLSHEGGTVMTFAGF